jgi:hypothetical protein
MRADEGAPSLHSRHLKITVNESGVEISYEPPLALTLGSQLRGRDIRGRVRSVLNHAQPAAKIEGGSPIVASFNFDAIQKLGNIIPKIDLMLDAYANERLTSKMVEEILGITAVERRLWHKDRRLPHSGMTSFRQGQRSFHLPLYSPQKIAWLAANRTIISQWRREDGTISLQRQNTPLFASE